MEGAEGETVSRHIKIGETPGFELSEALFYAGCTYLGGGLIRCQNPMHARAMADWLEMEGIPASDGEEIPTFDLLDTAIRAPIDPFDIMAGF